MTKQHSEPPRELELRRKVADLEKQVTQSNHTNLTPTDRERITKLVGLLVELDDLADPRRSTPITGQTRYRRPDSSKDEGAPTRWVRSFQHRARRQLDHLVKEWESRVDGSWKPTVVEKVRCMRRSCPNYGKRIPRFVGPAGEIELSHCSSCGNRMYTVDSKGA